MTSGQSAKRCLTSNTKTPRLHERTGISTPRPRANLTAPEAPAASMKAPQWAQYAIASARQWIALRSAPRRSVDSQGNVHATESARKLSIGSASRPYISLNTTSC